MGVAALIGTLYALVHIFYSSSGGIKSDGFSHCGKCGACKPGGELNDNTCDKAKKSKEEF